MPYLKTGYRGPITVVLRVSQIIERKQVNDLTKLSVLDPRTQGEILYSLDY